MCRGEVVVTGAGGFVCSGIICALARDGFESIAVDWFFQPSVTEPLVGMYRRLTGPILEILSNLQDVAPLVVNHGAAFISVPYRMGVRKADHVFLDSELLLAIPHWTLQNGASKFFFLNSMRLFRPSDGPPQDGLLTKMVSPSSTDVYVSAKSAGELLTSASTEVEFQTLSVRLRHLFGPHETVRDSRQGLLLISRRITNAQCHDLIKLETPHAPREWCWLVEPANCIVNLIAELFNQIGVAIHAGTPPNTEDLSLAHAVSMRVENLQISFPLEPHALVCTQKRHGIANVFSRLTWTPIEVALDQLTSERMLQ